MNRIATLALAAIFTSTMAHGQDVPERLCGYIEFPWRYSETHRHYYPVTPELAKRGRPYGSLDVTQATSIVQASSADLNGNSQVAVAYAATPRRTGGSWIFGKGRTFTLTPTPCQNEAPANEGYVCAATATLEGSGMLYDKHGNGAVYGETDDGTDYVWKIENASQESQAYRRCLGYVRADYPNYHPEQLEIRQGYPYCHADTYVVPSELSFGLHNLQRHTFQGTLQGVRIGVSESVANWPYLTLHLTIYETRDNCPALPANGD